MNRRENHFAALAALLRHRDQGNAESRVAHAEAQPDDVQLVSGLELEALGREREVRGVHLDLEGSGRQLAPSGLEPEQALLGIPEGLCERSVVDVAGPAEAPVVGAGRELGILGQQVEVGVDRGGQVALAALQALGRAVRELGQAEESRPVHLLQRVRVQPDQGPQGIVLEAFLGLEQAQQPARPFAERVAVQGADVQVALQIHRVARNDAHRRRAGAARQQEQGDREDPWRCRTERRRELPVHWDHCVRSVVANPHHVKGVAVARAPATISAHIPEESGTEPPRSTC